MADPPRIVLGQQKIDSLGQQIGRHDQLPPPAKESDGRVVAQPDGERPDGREKRMRSQAMKDDSMTGERASGVKPLGEGDSPNLPRRLRKSGQPHRF